MSSQVQSPEDPEAQLAKAVTEVENFENAHVMTVAVDRSARECVELERGDSTRLRLNFEVRPRSVYKYLSS
jgi:hypothetical protein